MSSEDPIYINSDVLGNSLILQNQERIVEIDSFIFVTLLVALRDKGWTGASHLFHPGTRAMMSLRGRSEINDHDAKQLSALLADILYSQEAEEETIAMVQPLITIASEGRFSIISSNNEGSPQASEEKRNDPQGHLELLAKQFEGTTLAKLVQTHLRRHSESQLLAAVRGLYQEFPEAFRPPLDEWSLGYATTNWIGPNLVEQDLGKLFREALSAAREEAQRHGFKPTEDQVFSMFNLAVLRLTHFAMSNRAFRRDFGIKKGWLW